MHRDSGDALLGGGNRSPGLRFGLLLAVVIGNITLTPWRAHGVLLAVGLVLVWLEASRSLHLRLALGGIAWCAVLAGVMGVWTGDTATATAAGVRMALATVWALWFGATVSWPALKKRLRDWRVPEVMLDAMDLSIAHALILELELHRRLEAAWVRQGFRNGQPALYPYAAVLGGGVELAFDRAVRLEDARRLRGDDGSSSQQGHPKTVSEGSDDPSLHGQDEAPLLALRSLDAAYPDGTLALHGMDLALEAGEWVAVAGPSGSGKSSLLRVVAGLMAASHGELIRFGKPAEGERLRDRLDPRVALVFQDPNDQLFGSTPLEDVAWGAMRQGQSEASARTRAQQALEVLGVAHLGARPVHRLSLGERKRVAFAGALLSGPELLLCDEPTGGLDPVASQRLITTLEAADARRPLTVLWATHDLDALPARVSRVVLLKEGQIVFDGPRARALQSTTLAKAGLKVLPPSDEAMSAPVLPEALFATGRSSPRSPSLDESARPCTRIDCPVRRGLS